jgi:hypothetical protein
MTETPGREDPRRPTPDDDPTAESRQTLWLLTISPTIWAVHFLASYITAAIWCAKLGAPIGSSTGPLGWVPWAVGIYTGIALLAIAIVGWIGWRRHTLGTATVPHDFDTPEDRHRFLGFATVLLSALSAVAVLYVGVVAVIFRTCR